jgi:hypothetical protein
MSTPVHVIVPGFAAITEFVAKGPDGQPITDDCGPCANEVCIAACQHRPPSVANMVAIRQRDIEHGWFTPHAGQDLHHVYLDATQLAGMQVTEVVQGSSIPTIHEALKAACVRGNPCVLDIFHASALPGNEPGVEHHFIAIGGIDTSKGYLVANGDHAPPTFGPVGTYWVTWNDLAKAQPVGLLEYHKPAPAPLPSPPPAPTEVEVLQAQIRTLQAKIAAAQHALA